MTPEETEVWIDAMNSATYQENISALRSAADDLDALWELDEARGKADGLGGAEYERLSHAPVLREIADHLETVRRILDKEPEEAT